MAEKHVVVTLSEPFELTAADFLSLDLDEERNEDKSTFIAGEKAYLRLFRGAEDPYVVESSGGITQIEATNVPLNVTEEYLIFANVKEATLQYKPYGAVSYSWVGRNGGNPVFNGKLVLLAVEAIAVLKCSYTTLFDRLSVKFDEAGPVIVFVLQAATNASTYLVVTFGAGVLTEPVPYSLEVKDFCSDTLLAGVTVYLDGAMIGQTDVNGVVQLGALTPGRTYQVRMQKDGFVDSNMDKLNNDSFTVPVTP